MNPDFSAMSRAELKRYVLSHREDMDALRELFVHRSNPNGKVYPADFSEEGLLQAEEALRLMVERLQQE